MGRYLYMEVTQDKYSLPLAVADTAEELARKVGTTKGNIYSALSHQKNRGQRPVEEAGSGRYKKFVRVKVEED